MTFIRLIAGRPIIVCGIFTAGLLVAASGPAWPADRFPFDQELLLEAAPMQPAKRLPILTVAPDGKATIDLWCKSVSARVELSDATIKIEPGPLPEALPDMMSEGQCTPARMSADEDMLAALVQVTAWRNQGSSLVLVGTKTLKFRPATN
jgi:heat shock protein HslJ